MRSLPATDTSFLDISHPIHYEINTDDDAIRKAAGLTGTRQKSSPVKLGPVA